MGNYVTLLPAGLSMAIPSALEISGDIVAAATTLGGLVLVFLGATFATYESYAPVQRGRDLRARFQFRAWFIFIGFALAVLAALLALAGKWLHDECFALSGLAIFVLSSIWVVAAAVLLVRDIK
jgi:hypothetical protein